MKTIHSFIVVGVVLILGSVQIIEGARKTQVDLLREEYGGFGTKAVLYDAEFLGGIILS